MSEDLDCSKSKRIAINTIVLYIRMIFLMAISLYTSRVLLSTLGVVDYGIQNVVGGFVTMFSLISGTMSTTISRFLTYEMGKGNDTYIKTVFSTSVNIQICFAIFIFILAEGFGVWFLNNKMVIPDDRLYAANWVFQCSLIAFCINLISVPYNAAIIAHERMSSFAYISILEAVLKLLIVFLITISTYDRLIIYSILLCIVALVIRFIYGFYCNKKFEECKYHYILDKPLLKQMFVFAGWNYLGAGASIFRTQGLNVLMNLFFGATVNAAKGLVTQVESAVTQFVGNFTMAINPQIIKSYASGDKNYMFQLVCMGAKYSYFLMLLMALPLITEAPYVLQLWLEEVPDYTVVFLRLTLLTVTIDVLSNTLVTSMQACGDIKKYQITIGTIVLMVFPISYILFKIGFPPYSCYVVCAVAMVVKLLFQLPLIKNMVGLPIKMYIKNVIIKIIVVSVLVAPASIVIMNIMDEGFLRLVINIVVVVIWGLMCIYLLGTEKNERLFINARICRLFHIKR